MHVQRGIGPQLRLQGRRWGRQRDEPLGLGPGPGQAKEEGDQPAVGRDHLEAVGQEALVEESKFLKKTFSLILK